MIMTLFIQKLANSLLQIVLFTLIPFIWWMITARREIGFFEWIGLKKIEKTNDNKIALWIIGVSAAFLVLSVFMIMSLKGVEMATSDFTGMGTGAIPSILVYAIFNTALPEEILFRGFLQKRVSCKFGPLVGNTVQSIIFGLMHGVMFVSMTGIAKAVIIILFTGLIGWFIGYVNEIKAQGSILPSWFIHSLANIFSGVCAAFSLFV